MASYTLLKPDLYLPENGVPAPLESCLLRGGRCQCGYVFFPMQDYGCENCGAIGAALQPESLPGTGELMASATVHMHQGEGREAPFIVASIKLDAGPVVRTLLDRPLDEEPPLPGRRVQAVLLPIDGGDTNMLDLRFRPQGEQHP